MSPVEVLQESGTFILATLNKIHQEKGSVVCSLVHIQTVLLLLEVYITSLFVPEFSLSSSYHSFKLFLIIVYIL